RGGRSHAAPPSTPPAVTASNGSHGRSGPAGADGRPAVPAPAGPQPAARASKPAHFQAVGPAVVAAAMQHSPRTAAIAPAAETFRRVRRPRRVATVRRPADAPTTRR